MEDCLIFVDNGFFKLVKKEFEIRTGKNKKFLQTFRNICRIEGFNLKHLFVYMAPPFQSRISTEEERFLKRKYDKIKKMLDKKSWATVREGRLQRLVDLEGNTIFNQKGVDSWIVADLCLFKRDFPRVNKIILISSDSDFAPIIQLVREKMGVEVILYTYFENKRIGRFYKSNYLLDAVSRWVKFEENHFSDGE